jgi:DNA mismatch repair protein MutS
LEKRQLGISFLDVSTGEFLTAQGNDEYIDKLLQNFNPSEILIAKKIKSIQRNFWRRFSIHFYLEDWVYKEDYAFETLTKHFQTNSLKGFGVEELTRRHYRIGSYFVLFIRNTTQ